MKLIPTPFLAFLLLLTPSLRARAEADAYVPGPDSKPQPGVPQGELIKFDFSNSAVFPGTTRHVTVYVPRQYDPAKPACVYVDQDGVQFEAPAVLDNLIARGELPVIIGVFVTPGVVPALNPATELPRFNRSFEYDGLGDAYARLLLDEVLPAVETKATADGRAIHLSHSGNDRAIAGSSSGAIAAFNAAWEHPEAFSRVISAIGTYVGLRGGDRFPTLIRKYEPKPIRVFLQDGSWDLNIYGGDWWMANQTMERALEFSGYEVAHEWGDGHHSGKHITSILPEALRFAWKDWPKPVGTGQTQNGALKALLIPGEGWQAVRSGVTGEPGQVAAHNGNRYIAEPAAGPGQESRVWLVGPGGKKSIVDTGLRSATGIALSPDQSLLYVADGATHWIYSYQIQPDGTLAEKQRYFWLHCSDTEDESHAGGMCCDKAGWLYVATDLGVQVCDQAGRVNAILPPPSLPVTNVRFGGAGLGTLYATCGSTVFARKLNAAGADPSAAPSLPSTPKL
jgi:enterochelin esterase-like enzyme